MTHSASMAHDALPTIFDALDPSGRWRRLQHAQLWVGSLYEYAQRILRYDEKGLRPLSIDGREGREFQAMIVGDAIEQLRKNSRFVHSVLKGCGDGFQQQFMGDLDGSVFVYELMNEIACVIDAENVRMGNDAGNRYLQEKREKWQMPLNSTEERRAVLDIYESYRGMLEVSQILSMDQMIADLNRYLETHEWTMLRGNNGFDAIFLDELHFFNRAERMVFHGLIKADVIASGRMPLFMSYDLKQSPTDSFLGGGAAESAATFFQRIKAGESQLVELTEVFRSTPQIAEFLGDLDAAFPALDLEGEWMAYGASSSQEPGERPQIYEYENALGLLDDVFRRAAEDASEFGGRHVAVLCMNETLYTKYLTVGRIADKFWELSGRDKVGELKYIGKRRCVFSMPEYVAGLQFRSVYLIHVDKADSDLGDAGVGPKRRFVSRCYLGASRAAEKLQIATCRERGGRADLLTLPIERGSATLVETH
jgi:hypothetical protein